MPRIGSAGKGFRTISIIKPGGDLQTQEAEVAAIARCTPGAKPRVGHQAGSDERRQRWFTMQLAKHVTNASKELRVFRSQFHFPNGKKSIVVPSHLRRVSDRAERPLESVQEIDPLTGFAKQKGAANISINGESSVPNGPPSFQGKRGAGAAKVVAGTEQIDF